MDSLLRWAAGLGPVQVVGGAPAADLLLFLVAVGVFLNAAVGVAGRLLWRAGWIRPTPATGLRAVVELVLFTVVMDALIHAGHRIAHRRRVYRLVHDGLGFYTTVWDRLFGTIDPAYDRTWTGTATPTNRPC